MAFYIDPMKRTKIFFAVIFLLILLGLMIWSGIELGLQSNTGTKENAILPLPLLLEKIHEEDIKIDEKDVSQIPVVPPPHRIIKDEHKKNHHGLHHHHHDPIILDHPKILRHHTSPAVSGNTQGLGSQIQRIIPQHHPFLKKKKY